MNIYLTEEMDRKQSAKLCYWHKDIRGMMHGRIPMNGSMPADKPHFPKKKAH